MIFLWVIWIWVLIWVFIDIFRSRDMSGWAKALWFLFVLFIPLIGVVVYLIARGDSMNERAAQQARQQDQEFRSYVREAAADSPASMADQLAKLADLRDRGVISAGESSAGRPRSWRPDDDRRARRTHRPWAGTVCGSSSSPPISSLHPRQGVSGRAQLYVVYQPTRKR